MLKEDCKDCEELPGMILESKIDSGILPQVNQALTIISDLYEIAPHCIEFKRLSMEIYNYTL